MDAIEVVVDRELFTEDMVMRAAHRYTDTHTAVLTAEPSCWRIAFTPLSTDQADQHVARCFHNDVLDERLRERVRAQTEGLHAALVQAALLGATSTKP
jgi:His-Xaa-Ser system protein HxsD